MTPALAPTTQRALPGTQLEELNAANPCAGPFGRIYDFCIERERLSRLIGGLVWGVDNALLYRSLPAIATVPAGGTILDVPCGGGVALRALHSSQDVRYLAFDLDEEMVSRTRRRAERLGLTQVKAARADAAHLPVGDCSADLLLSHGGLHCFADPAAALDEYARALKPGGRLIGTAFLSPGGMRQRLLFAADRRRTGLPLLWSADQLREHLARLGLTGIGLTASAGLTMFEACGSNHAVSGAVNGARRNGQVTA